MSQLIVFLPLFFLYEVSIIISARVSKEQERREEEEWS
jgi:sec-independent protein translocase protein TatC